MIAYHGSCHNFRTLRLCPQYTGQSTRENEGVGIYFSINRSVAEFYGQYIYTLEINDDALLDLRKKTNAKKYVSAMLANVRKKTKVPVQKYLDVPLLADDIVNGRVFITNLGERAMSLFLDSNERWYSDGITETQRQMSTVPSDRKTGRQEAESVHVLVPYQKHWRYQRCFAECCENYWQGKDQLLRRSRRKK